MATTIQISDTTKQELESLKETERINTYDALIKHLIRKHTKIPKSMFGSMKGVRWKKEYRMDFDHEL